MKYKLMILVISSNDVKEYEEFKKIGKQYLSLFRDHIKFFYLEYDNEKIGNSDSDNDVGSSVIENGDDLYFKGTESVIPGIYNKTIKAIEYVDKHYDYEYILRTNLSSFLNLYNILSFLEKIPKTEFGGGFIHAEGFISGTGIFMSRDVGNKLVSVGTHYTSAHNDDVFISSILTGILRIDIKQIQNYTMKYFVNNSFNKDITYPENVLYFRIKNADRRIDVLYFKLLLSQLYHLHI